MTDAFLVSFTMQLYSSFYPFSVTNEVGILSSLGLKNEMLSPSYEAVLTAVPLQVAALAALAALAASAARLSPSLFLTME